MIGPPFLPRPYQPWVHRPVVYTMACPDCGRDLDVTATAVLDERTRQHVPRLCMPCVCSPCPCPRCTPEEAAA